MQAMLAMLVNLLENLDRIVVDDARPMLNVLRDLLTKLSSEGWEVWFAELKKWLRREPCWSNGQVAQVTQPKPTPSILELVSTVVVSATTSKFVAKDRFVINTLDDAPVKISDLGNNFITWFLGGDGKTEDPVSEQTLRYHRLRKASVDAPIITELGGEEKSETTLMEMFSLMEKQKNGEDGVLLNNVYANIFYIRDQNGVLRAVRVRWYGVGWRVGADSVGRPHWWADGYQVFSRNSVIEHLEPSVPVTSLPMATKV